MVPRLPRFDVRGWLARAWQQMPFVRRRGGPGLAGVREPRRPRPPTRPPQAMSAEPEAGDSWTSPVSTLARRDRHRWWRRIPRAGQA
ncbi:MAG: hypothetical protein ACRDPY_33525 [Streptosporangiaceae bacterium]